MLPTLRREKEQDGQEKLNGEMYNICSDDNSRTSRNDNLCLVKAHGFIFFFFSFCLLIVHMVGLSDRNMFKAFHEMGKLPFYPSNAVVTMEFFEFNSETNWTRTSTAKRSSIQTPIILLLINPADFPRREHSLALVQ